MNNLSSYCGLVDAKIRASDKELPVAKIFFPGPHLTEHSVAWVLTEYTSEKKGKYYIVSQIVQEVLTLAPDFF